MVYGPTSTDANTMRTACPITRCSADHISNAPPVRFDVHPMMCPVLSGPHVASIQLRRARSTHSPNGGWTDPAGLLHLRMPALVSGEIPIHEGASPCVCVCKSRERGCGRHQHDEDGGHDGDRGPAEDARLPFLVAPASMMRMLWMSLVRSRTTHLFPVVANSEPGYDGTSDAFLPALVRNLLDVRIYM